MKIGITQQGDASLDLSWIDKLQKVDGAIIISKGFNDKFEQALIENQNKIIYHATCTGLGNTILEKKVPNYQSKLNHIKNLILNSFQPRRIVLRIDPIIPMEIAQQVLKNDYIAIIKQILDFCLENKINRIRYSYLDLYNHVKQRLHQQNIKINNEYFNAVSFAQMDKFEQLFDEYQNKGLIINSCGEMKTKESRKVGCISKQDFEILGLDYSKIDNIGYQRKYCLCCSAKTQLLNNKTRCPFKCLYCYWKD